MWEIYDYKDDRNKNVVQEWAKNIPKPQLKKLQAKLDILAKAGPELPPGLLIKTEVEYIYKLKIQGNPKLRPMLCFGPFGDEKAFTILLGVKEISWEFVPANAEAEAADRRRKLIIVGDTRREKHVRLNK